MPWGAGSTGWCQNCGSPRPGTCSHQEGEVRQVSQSGEYRGEMGRMGIPQPFGVNLTNVLPARLCFPLCDDFHCMWCFLSHGSFCPGHSSRFSWDGYDLPLLMSPGGDDGKDVIIKASYGSVPSCELVSMNPRTCSPDLQQDCSAAPAEQYFSVDVLLGLF